MRRHLYSGTVLLALGVASLVACGEGDPPDAPTSLREVGVLQFEGVPSHVQTQADGPPGKLPPIVWDHPPIAGSVSPPLVIEMPDTVRVGQSVDVIVRTLLVNACWSTDGQDVTTSGIVVEVTPRDTHSGAQFCSMIKSFGEHHLRVSFASAGTGALRVHGRLMRSSDLSTTYEPVNAERKVVIK